MGGHRHARGALLAGWASVLLVLVTPLASADTQQPLIPPHATVVLLSGLPGDVESENNYQDQLQSWMQTVENDGQAARLFVLCDNPQALKFPVNLKLEHFRSDRENFLAVGQKLAGIAEPVVVVAWGHGGKQGSRPVLHVRGPRITADDFASMAAQFSDTESHWVLLFRGSGAFASRLAGARRQIISSDHLTAFTSDPAANPLLLKIVRGNPTLPFPKLAEEFGRGTAKWYSERHLARTEEPTLWLAEEQPRVLAESAAEEAGQSESKPGSTPTPINPDSQQKPGPAPAVPHELSPAWKEIKKVDAEKYPEADGVILRQRLSCTLGSNPAVSTEQEQFIQILNPEGKQFGDFDVSYSPPFEEIEFLDCEVLRPDGGLSVLDPDAIGEAHEQPLGDYETARRKFFSLPGVVPGAVLHVRFRTHWKQFPLPQISMELPIDQEMPAVESTVQVTVAREVPLHFAFEEFSAPDPVIKQSSYSTSYTWRLTDVSGHRREILTPPHHGARLLLSTFTDWASFAQWYERISQLTAEVTPEIDAKAQDLTRSAHTDRQKVLALYNYVTALRYVAVPLGVNSFRPHAAANVLANQFGDCKDKANLLNALLHAVKMDAHLVLVPRFGQAHDAIPGFAFNHAISQVTLGNDTLWLDTTDDVCRFGLLPPGDPGRKVLVIDGKTKVLTQLPPADPSRHRLQLQGRITCSGQIEALQTTLTATASGYPDYEFRTAARDTKEHRASLPLLAAKFRPAAGSFALEKQTATSVSALEEDFSWQAEGTCAGLVSEAGGKRVVHSPFWLPKEWDLALHHRHSPLFLNQGYPLTLDEEFEIGLPAKAQVTVLPPTSTHNEPPLQWKLEWSRVGDDKLSARFHAELAQGELSDPQTLRFQQQLRILMSALGADAIVTTKP